MDPTEVSLIVFALTIGAFLLGFWIWMLVDCIRNESDERYERLIWMAVILLTKLVGAFVYFFWRRPQRMRKQGVS